MLTTWHRVLEVREREREREGAGRCCGRNKFSTSKNECKDSQPKEFIAFYNLTISWRGNLNFFICQSVVLLFILCMLHVGYSALSTSC